MALITADVLKKHFNIWAHFYKAQAGEKEYLMRSEARIIRKGKESAKTDAVIVMANPGSCSAVDKNAKFEAFPKDGGEKEFVAANPDPTQYQLMNLMERMKWNCIKIINLSDVCTGNFDEFKKFLKEFRESNNKSHSIFNEKRLKELENHLELNPTLIYAWGGEAAIKQFTRVVIEKEKKHKGLLHSERSYYRHPRPAKYADRIIWLNEMEVHLKEA
ncbi:hypothetical protein ACOI1C_19490 [Bacillus sp. DJP31]|uniref:hypothetical protein n=1 Tax=Bacillus sp. DJP31 TaxID=3409789 RepID=UPI003BB63C3D